MIVVHEHLSKDTATKPMECPKCENKRAFDVPVGACVRKAKRGRPPPDVVILKCKKCGHRVGISTEQE